jgi:H/ACA ribonucleoprotein complex subunit 4
MEILDRSGKDMCLQIRCEAGTYIRKLFDDIGKLIGGAHMKELRRIAAGLFAEQQAHTMQEVADAYAAYKKGDESKIRQIILPVESALPHIKKIYVKDSAIRAISNGSPVFTGGISKLSSGINKNELIVVMTLKGELVALAKADMSSEEIMSRRGRAARTDRVIITR